MFILKSIGCRMFQTAFRLALPILPYREPKLLASCSELGSVMEATHIKRVLIVTDKGIEANGLTRPVTDALKASNVSFAIYDETLPNPTTDNVEAALSIYIGQKCDALIAIGGGSSMDCAKAVGARIAYPNRSLGQLGGVLRVLRKLPPVIAIPTTAGTGSEVTLAAVITDSKTHHKYALMSFPLIPRYAVLDPHLTTSLPPNLTATTGMDALTHAVESYIGRSTTAETRELALEATKLIFANIRKAYENGDDLEARRNMLTAAYKAGNAFSKSYVGYIHAIAHTLGGEYGAPHGLANAVIMPYILEAYGSSAYVKLKELAVAAGVCTELESPRRAARKFISAVRALNESMGIPSHLDCILESDIPRLAKYADKEANPLYPVPKLFTKDELAKFYYIIGDLNDKRRDQNASRKPTKFLPQGNDNSRRLQNPSAQEVI